MPCSPERLLPGPDRLVRIALKKPFSDGTIAVDLEPECVAGSRYRPWAELLKRTFGVDVETCSGCGGRMRLLAVITDLASAVHFLRRRGERMRGRIP